MPMSSRARISKESSRGSSPIRTSPISTPITPSAAAIPAASTGPDPKDSYRSALSLAGNENRELPRLVGDGRQIDDRRLAARLIRDRMRVEKIHPNIGLDREIDILRQAAGHFDGGTDSAKAAAQPTHKTANK